MFERVIAQTIQKVGTEVLRDRSLISLAEILEDERIPSRFKPFFETEVSWWLYNEGLARAANKRFDYDHPELSSLLTYLEQVQFRHARFEREDFLTVLDSAVKLTFNFICRPQTTLKWYIFRGEPVKPLREVMLRFGAFADYDYFRNVFAEWVDRKQSERPTFDAISSTEFERVIRRIDDQILLSCTVEDLLALMDPFFDFIGEQDDYQVPVDALIVFFDDKNIKKLVDYLEGWRAKGKESVGREEFLALLDELLTSAEDEPEADFSTVYQNDELDDVVRLHLHTDLPTGAPVDDLPPQPAVETPVEEPPVEPEAAAPVFSLDDLSADRTEEDFDDEYDEGGPGLPTDMSADDIGRHLEFINDVRSSVAAGLNDFERADAAALSAASDDDMVDDDDMEQEPVDSRPAVEAAPLPPPAPPPTPVPAPVSADLSDDGDEDDDDESPSESAPPIHTAWSRDSGIPHGPAAAEVVHRTVAEANGASRRDVRHYIDAMLERKVVKKVFQRNRGEYEAALDKINAADDWRAASQILDDLFIRFDVDPYSRTAIRFTDSVYGRYLSTR